MTSIDGPRLAARSGKARQLVVFLHGYGANGDDLIEPDIIEASERLKLKELHEMTSFYGAAI